MDFVRHQQGNLTPEMDIFCSSCSMKATACLIGQSFYLTAVVILVPVPLCPKLRIQIIIRELVEQRISKDPNSRLSAAELNMSKYRGIIFPEQFYAFLNKYCT